MPLQKNVSLIDLKKTTFDFPRVFNLVQIYIHSTISYNRNRFNTKLQCKLMQTTMINKSGAIVRFSDQVYPHYVCRAMYVRLVFLSQGMSLAFQPTHRQNADNIHDTKQIDNISTTGPPPTFRDLFPVLIFHTKLAVISGIISHGRNMMSFLQHWLFAFFVSPLVKQRGFEASNLSRQCFAGSVCCSKKTL